MATKIGTNYIYSGKGPFDAKMLVNTVKQLTEADTFGGYQYNGMIVGVSYNQSTNVNEVGIYYLHDPKATSGFSPVDNTKAENWHKLGTVAELEAVRTELDNLYNQVEGLATKLTEIEKKFLAYDAAIAALQEVTAEQTNALVALVAQDIGKSVRDITKEEIASEMVDTTTDLGNLVLRIGSAEAAIEALQAAGGGISEETVDAMISNAISTLDASNIISNDDTYDIGYNISNPKELVIRSVNISKLYQDVEFILHGGSASKGNFN